MSFERFRVQSEIERAIGCTDLGKWHSYNQKFKGFVLTESQKNAFLPKLRADSADMYFKAVLSLAEAVNSLCEGRHSWAAIKIYYAVFFLLIEQSFGMSKNVVE